MREVCRQALSLYSRVPSVAKCSDNDSSRQKLELQGVVALNVDLGRMTLPSDTSDEVHSRNTNPTRAGAGKSAKVRSQNVKSNMFVEEHPRYAGITVVEIESFEQYETCRHLP